MVIAILHLLSNMSLSTALNVNKLDLSSVLVLTLWWPAQFSTSCINQKNDFIIKYKISSLTFKIFLLNFLFFHFVIFWLPPEIIHYHKQHIYLFLVEMLFNHLLYDNLEFTRIYYFYNIDARVQNKMARGPTRFASSVECDKKGKICLLTVIFLHF